MDKYFFRAFGSGGARISHEIHADDAETISGPFRSLLAVWQGDPFLLSHVVLVDRDAREMRLYQADSFKNLNVELPSSPLPPCEFPSTASDKDAFLHGAQKIGRGDCRLFLIRYRIFETRPFLHPKDFGIACVSFMVRSRSESVLFLETGLVPFPADTAFLSFPLLF